MKTLDEFNKERIKSYQKFNKADARKNGIACPKCGDELIDANPGRVLMSNPPRLDVLCEDCGYIGTRAK